MAERTSLSAILKRYRVAAGLSQEALAARAGLSVRAISDLERGLHRTARSSTLDLLASALALSPQQRAILLVAARPALDEPLPYAFADTRYPRRPPTPPTALIGREQERSRIQELLAERGRRLVTLSGPSGVGKTRLALQVADDLSTAFSDGVVFVDLAPMRDATLFYGALSQALALRERALASPADLVTAALHNKRMLLVLDNFEHVLDAAPLVADLLERCPTVSILVTSRAPLRLRAEQRMPLAPLALDAAVALFSQRARAIWPDGAYPAAVVEAICERVDRLPLAIELAAVQTRVLPAPDLLEHLTHRLALLRGGARDLPARQQTMEDAIAWSYELLSDEQQRCFRALGVFVGGWTLDAAHAVCWADAAVDAPDALLTLAALVDASLVQTEETASGAARFYLLELLREYALAQLANAGEESACRRRHAEYFAEVAETIAHFGPGHRPHHADPAPEAPNARVALEWAQRAGEATLGLRLAGFARLWHVRGQMREAVAWQERMLALDEQVRAQAGSDTPLRLRAERLYGLARTLLGCGDVDRAESLATDALRLAQRIGDEATISNAFATLGMVAQARGQYDAAASAFVASYEHTEPTDQTGLRYRVAALLAEAERRLGNEASAMTLLEGALAGAESIGNTWDSARITTMLGQLACQQRRYTQATRYYLRALTLFRPFGSPSFSAWCLEGFAAVLVGDARYMQATRLCAAATSLRARAQTPAPATEREAIETMMAIAQTSLGEPAFSEAWRVGCALSGDAAIAQALAEAARRINSAALVDGLSIPGV
jgi:predicted ATPase/DNA-binding XRE family transcriptional regulator